MLTPDQEAAVAELIAHATAGTGVSSGRPLTQLVRRWAERIRSGLDPNPTSQRPIETRWEDSPSSERPGWTARSAYIAGTTEPAFEIDVEVCRQCGIGWVEQPYTSPEFQRRGLAAAGLASLRRDHPEASSWYTLGGHLSDSRRLWVTAGADIPGGYQQRDLCRHVKL